MNVETQFALYIRDLLVFPEAKMFFTESNDYINDFSTDFIVMYALNEKAIATSKRYINNDTEELATQYSVSYSVSFYGDNARENAQQFVMANRSAKSLELQALYQIGVFNALDVKNVNILLGSTYRNRYDVSLNVVYTNVFLTPLDYIESAELEIYTEKQITNIEVIGD